MNDIDFLEHGRQCLTLLHAGREISLPDPRTLHYQVILAALHLRHAPGTPGGEPWKDHSETLIHPMPEWKRALVFERWRAAYDLPAFNDGQRLAYLVDKYRAPIAADLRMHAHMDLGELWRERRWVTILDVLDRLPGHSWFSSAVSMDEEHAAMMAESIQAQAAASGQQPEAKGPSLTGWTNEVAALTNVLDAVRAVQHTIVAVNSERGKVPEPPKPAPRPVTPLEKALKAAAFAARKAKHESLVARVLPHKAQSEG